MTGHLKQVTFLILTALVSAPSVADSDAEREALSRITHELNALEPLIQRAEANADQDARIQFRYDWLRQDLNKVKDGIDLHIEAPRVYPRAYPPLGGDYRR
jgi:RAQPRD family integrative conjugative element protein